MCVVADFIVTFRLFRSSFYSFEYKNEAGGDPSDKPANAPDIDPNGDVPKSYSIPVYSTHQLVIENVAFYMEEFRIGTAARGNCDPMYGKHTEASPAAEQFYSTMSELPDIQHSTAAAQALNDEVSSCSDDDNDCASEISDINRTEALQIASLNGKADIKITVKVSQKHIERSISNRANQMFMQMPKSICSKRSRCKGQKCNWSYNSELWIYL